MGWERFRYCFLHKLVFGWVSCCFLFQAATILHQYATLVLQLTFIGGLDMVHSLILYPLYCVGAFYLDGVHHRSRRNARCDWQDRPKDFGDRRPKDETGSEKTLQSELPFYWNGRKHNRFDVHTSILCSLYGVSRLLLFAMCNVHGL